MADKEVDRFNSRVQKIGNSQTEIAFLAYLYKDPEKIYRAADLIKPEDFTSPLNRAVYDQMIKLSLRDDIGSVVFDRSLIEHGLQPWPGQASSISPNDFFDTLNVLTPEQKSHGFTFYLEAIYTASTRRKLLYEMKDLEEFLFTAKGDKVSEILTHIDATISSSIASFTCPDVPVPIVSNIEELFDQDREEDWILSSGFPFFNDAIGGGLAPGTFHVIMGRSGAGKSSFLLAAATEILQKAAIPILYLDTELSIEQVQFRWLAMISGIEEKEIRLGWFRRDKTKVAKLRAAYEMYKEQFGLHLKHIKVAGWSSEQILATMRRWYLQCVKDHSSKNKGLIIYDYLKSTAGEYGKNVAEHQALGNKLQLFHDFAANYHIPILSGAQVNREGILRRGRNGQQHHAEDHEGVLAMSDRIMWFSDSLSLWRRKTEEELNRDNQRAFNGDHILLTLKARSGPAHDFTVEIADGIYEREHINYLFDKPHMQIRELGLHSTVIAGLRHVVQLGGNGQQQDAIPIPNVVP